MKRQITATLTAALTGVLAVTLTGCTGGKFDDTSNQQADYQQDIQEAQLDQYEWEQEVELDRIRQDAYTDRAVEDCIDVNWPDIYDYDELAGWCEVNAYDSAPFHYADPGY